MVHLPEQVATIQLQEERLSIFVPYYTVNFPDSLTERRCDAPRIAVDGF